MKRPGIFSVIVALIVIIFFILLNGPNTEKTLSSVDNEHYNVVGSYDDSRQAADTLAIVNNKMLNFLQYLKIKYDINSYNVGGGNASTNNMYEPMSARKKIVKRAVEGYNPEVIFENPPGGKDTSYTIDKGEKLMMCLRGKSGLIHDPHTIMFVALHELAHIGNENWGHESDFWEVFKFILKEARESGIHTPVDYSKRPIRYCGLDINHNPYFDASITDI